MFNRSTFSKLISGISLIPTIVYLYGNFDETEAKDSYIAPIIYSVSSIFYLLTQFVFAKRTFEELMERVSNREGWPRVERGNDIFDSIYEKIMSCMWEAIRLPTPHYDLIIPQLTSTEVNPYPFIFEPSVNLANFGVSSFVHQPVDVNNQHQLLPNTFDYRISQEPRPIRISGETVEPNLYNNLFSNFNNALRDLAQREVNSILMRFYIQRVLRTLGEITRPNLNNATRREFVYSFILLAYEHLSSDYLADDYLQFPIANQRIVNVTRPLATAHNLILPDSNDSGNQYTPYMQNYLDYFKGKMKNTEAVEKYKIPDSEVEKYLCPISGNVPDIPVRLNEKVFDLNCLLKLEVDNSGLRTDPINKCQFVLQHLQPARNKQQKIEGIISKYKKIYGDRHAKHALNLLKQGNNSLASKHFQIAIQIYDDLKIKNERLTTYHYNLATAYDRLNSRENALKHCQTCLKLRIELFGENNEATFRAKAKLEALQNKLNFTVDRLMREIGNISLNMSSNQ